MLSTPFHNYDLYEYIMTGYCKKKTKDMIIYDDVCLAPLPKAVPAFSEAKWAYQSGCKIKEEGKTLMRYNDNYASASVQTVTPKSDAQVGREYLLNRLEAASYPKRSSFEKMFNLYVSNEPKNFQEVIDRIKNDKFKINKKVQKKLDALKADADETGADDFPWYHGWSYGIEWDGPKADFAGYEQALSDCDAEQTKARDIIMTSDNAAGLKALQDFEAWTPTVATTTVQ